MIFSAGGLELYFNKTTFGVERLAILGDPEGISWVRGNLFGLPSGNNFLTDSKFAAECFSARFLYFEGIVCDMTVEKRSEAIAFRYLFKNQGKKSVSLSEGDLGLYLPFNDDFAEPDISLRRRVHAHVRPQGVAYVFCERYSGDLPSLGLLFTKGESYSYSLERTGRASERGLITLSFPEMTLGVGDSYECEFVLFSCTNEKEFFDKADDFGVLTAQTSGLAVFPGEKIEVLSRRASSLETEGEGYLFEGGACSFIATGQGEKKATISRDGQKLILTYYVLSEDLPQKRARFLSDHQYIDSGEYQGAFTAYDLKAGAPIVKRGVRSPFSLAGFRAAPLLFLLREGKKGTLNEELSAKIGDSIAFYDREIYRNGEVSDDVGGKRARLFKRFYNYPLFSAIKYEEYLYSGDMECLLQSALILKTLYHSGSVYEVAPTCEVVSALLRAGKEKVAEELVIFVREAADKLIKSGNKYAPFKGLPYGPEIVYGALSTLLDAYALTEKEYYLATAKEHLARLDAFAASSVHYATDLIPEIFQRDRGNELTYDMSPHFTAAHIAVVYEKYARLSGEGKYLDRASRILKSALSLFGEDGSSRRSKAAARVLNDAPLPQYEEISCGEDVVLYYFDLLFGGK